MRDRQLFVKSTIADWTLHTRHFSSITYWLAAHARLPKKTQTRTYVDVHYLWFSHRMEEGPKPCDEPKFVIFYNMLVAIFQLFCFHCKCNNPSIEVCKDRENGKCNPKMQSLWETIQVEEPAVNVWKASWKCDVKLWYVDIRSKDQPSTTYVQEYGSLLFFCGHTFTTKRNSSSPWC